MNAKRHEELLRVLKGRFEKNMNRHKALEWTKVQAKLEANTEKLWSLNEMERTGGEPDVVGHDQETDEYIFYDCSEESPKGRRTVCYDREGLESRKEHKPENNAIDMAAAMGIELLTEEQYRELQQLGDFDSKTSSWRWPTSRSSRPARRARSVSPRSMRFERRSRASLAIFSGLSRSKQKALNQFEITMRFVVSCADHAHRR